MKKLIAILLALIMVLALAACGGEPGETASGGEAGQTEPRDQEQNPEQTQPQAQTPSVGDLTVEALKVLPETPASEFTYSTSLNYDGIQIDSYTGTDDIVVIPQQIDGRNVVEVAGYCFANDSQVRAVLIPDTVVEITNTFVNNTVVELVIAEGVETFGFSVFNNCTALKEVVMGDSVHTIEKTSFFFCTALEKLNIPASLTEMNEEQKASAFLGCEKLTIYGEAGSYIESVANELGIPFVAE